MASWMFNTDRVPLVMITAKPMTGIGCGQRTKPARSLEAEELVDFSEVFWLSKNAASLGGLLACCKKRR